MRTALRVTIIMGIFLVICAGLFAGGFALSGLGSRAMSMGGAFRGLADDATAIYWNPAGLAYLTSNELSLGGSLIKPEASWQNTLPLPGFGLDPVNSAGKLSMIPSLLGVYADNPNIVLGLGVYVPYGVNSAYDAYFLPDSMNGNPVAWPEGFPEQELVSKVSVYDIHPSLGYKITGNLSFGLGISVLYGDIALQQLKPHDTYSYYVPTTLNMSGKGWGMGANAGLMYKPFRNLALGFNGRFPSTLNLEGDSEILLWLNDAVNYSLLGVYEPHTYGGSSDITATLNLPGELGFGLSWQAIPQLAVNLDYSYTLWNSLESIVVEMADSIMVLTNEINSTELPFNWNSTNRVSLGAEYKLGCNAIRGGVYWDQSPIPVENQTVTLSDIGDKISANLGFGRSFGNLTLDLNGQYVMFPKRTVTTPSGTNNPGVYNASVIAGGLNIGYRF
jgi:long-chain fatty acid transport protein